MRPAKLHRNSYGRFKRISTNSTQSSEAERNNNDGSSNSNHFRHKLKQLISHNKRRHKYSRDSRQVHLDPLHLQHRHPNLLHHPSPQHKLLRTALHRRRLRCRLPRLGQRQLEMRHQYRQMLAVLRLRLWLMVSLHRLARRHHRHQLLMELCLQHLLCPNQYLQIIHLCHPPILLVLLMHTINRLLIHLPR